jgi:hypothetical protein
MSEKINVQSTTDIRDLSYPSQNILEEKELKITKKSGQSSHRDDDENDEEEVERTVKPLKFPMWIYLLFGVLFAILFVVPYAIQYLPHDEVVIQITRDEIAKNPVYSKVVLFSKRYFVFIEA